jgi:predicted ATPase/DNA-binding SARP family transcriptional activator
MRQLRIALFGYPAITLDDEQLAIPERKALALIAYLALSGERHSRATLALRFWPDLDQARAFAYLRHALWSLRQAQLDPWLEGDRATVRLRPGYWLDVAAFRQALDAGEYAAAVALGQAEFLEGFGLRDAPGFEEWQLQEAEQLRQELAQALRRLLAQRTIAGAYGEAIEYARRWLALDPLDEAAHRQLMLLHAWNAQPAAAIRQYEECARLLRAELAAEPDRETQELYLALRARQPPPPPAPRPHTPVAEPTPAPAAGAGEAATAEPARPARLPTALNLFVGRTRDVVAISQLLGATRLLTLTGSGGIGKTRLALETAAALRSRYPDGVAFVDLAPIRSPQLVLPTIGQALGIRDEGLRPARTLLQEALGTRRMLLVLDNFEQVLEAAPQLIELLIAAPGLRLLVTSRAPLRVSGEQEYPVPPLALPEADTPLTPQQALEYATIGLFVLRAQAVQPGFALDEANLAAVVAICRQLEGLPLAIELAAARIRLLPPQALRARLSQRLALLTGGGSDRPPRHQTMRDAIAWSYDLLAPTEQRLFARLAVFVGGFSLGAAEQLADCPTPIGLGTIDLLDSLLNKNLLAQRDIDGEPRFLMLEVVREYAAERLEASGDALAVRACHSAYVLALAQRAEPELRGPAQQAWLRQLDQEQDNLRAALARLYAADELLPALDLAGKLWRFWWMRGYMQEGRAWLDQILGRARLEHARRPEDAALARAYGAALYGAGALARGQSDLPAMRGYLEASLAVWGALADEPELAKVLNGLGLVASEEGDVAGARGYFEQSLATFRALDDRWGIATVAANLALVLADLGEAEAAQALCEESLALQRAGGNTQGIANALSSLGRLLLRRGEARAALEAHEQELALREQLGNTAGIAYALIYLGEAARHAGDLARARAHFEQSIGLMQTLGEQHGAALAAQALASLPLAPRA